MCRNKEQTNLLKSSFAFLPASVCTYKEAVKRLHRPDGLAPELLATFRLVYHKQMMLLVMLTPVRDPESCLLCVCSGSCVRWMRLQKTPGPVLSSSVWESVSLSCRLAPHTSTPLW